MKDSRLNRIPIVVEKHPDTFVAYPLGVDGVVIGEGDSFEAALADCRSAIRFHVGTFGEKVLEIESPLLEATLVQPTTA